MTTVIAEFDGKVFVPQQPVELPAGTRVMVEIPPPTTAVPARPRPPSEEEHREWQRFMEELNSSEPYFPTVEAAIGYTRRYPGYYP